MSVLIDQYKIGSWNRLPPFLDLVYFDIVRRNREDQLCWKSFSREVLDVRSFYKVLHSTSQLPIPLKTVWKLKVPTKIGFFLWTTALGRILNIDNLWRCQVVIDWCCICKRDEDTIIYLHIALSLESCGIWCFHYLRFIGLCRMMLWSFLLAG